jgi:sec-independent protein translocase protein TatA
MGLLGGHGLEFIIVIVIALLVFGPKRLPEMGSAIGKSITEFRKGMSSITQPKEDDTSTATQDAAASARLELEAIERELAAKKAALAAQEAAQPEVNATSASEK